MQIVNLILKPQQSNPSDTTFVLADYQPFEDASILWLLVAGMDEAVGVVTKLNRDLEFTGKQFELGNYTLPEITEGDKAVINEIYTALK